MRIVADHEPTEAGTSARPNKMTAYYGNTCVIFATVAMNALWYTLHCAHQRTEYLTSLSWCTVCRSAPTSACGSTGSLPGPRRRLRSVA